jgi:hypothetical protein
MSFDPLSALFERFKHLTPPDESVRKKMIEIIAKRFGKDLSMQDVKVRNNVVYIQTRSAVKSEVFLQKSDILLELNTALNKHIVDIR